MIFRKIIKYVFLLIAALLLISAFAFLTALYYKKDIMAAVKAEVDRRINGSVEVKDIKINIFQNFPNLSLSLIDIKVADSLYHVHKKHLFIAQNISFSVSLYALFQKRIEVGEITLSNGSVNLFKDNSNYFNGNILKRDTSEQEDNSDLPIDFSLKRVQLKNIAFTFEYPAKQRKIAFLINENHINVNIKPRAIVLISKGSYEVDQLTFKETRGSFLKNKNIELLLQTTIDIERKLITFEESEINADGEKYDLKGLLALKTPAELTIEISSADASFEEVQKLLTPKIAANLSKLKLKERASGRARIFALLAQNKQPELDVNFELKNSDVAYNNWKAYAKVIKGSYTNHHDSTKEIGDENSRIVFSEIEGSYLTFPVKATGYIKNVTNPFLHVAGTSAGSMDLLNNFLNPDKMEFDGGRFKVDFTLRGVLTQLSNKKTFRSGKTSLLLNGKLSGANFSYFPRNLEFASINGNFFCDWNDLHVKDLSLLLNKNKINIHGDVSNLTSFILSEGAKVKGNLHVYSPGVVFDNFSFTKENVIKKKQKRQTMDEVVSKMDKLIDVVELDLNFETPRFNFRKFEAQDINGTITAVNSDFILNNFSFKSANGSYKFSGAIKNIGTNAAQVSAKGNITDADVQEVFASFENFKQNTITEKNLRGKINAKIDFGGKINHSGNIIAESMNGDFTVEIKNGHLINFEPIEKLGGFIFKNRDFKNISFEDIQNRFILKGKTLSVGKMEIISSVFTLYVDGVHNFDSYTDLNIQAPISNLRKRSKVKKVKAENGVKNVGLSVYVKAYSDGNKMKFSYQPFKSINGNKVVMEQDTTDIY
jgi:uncharacterized protein involved in outer membrane biogenesis